MICLQNFFDFLLHLIFVKNKYWRKFQTYTTRGRAEVARQAHNLKVEGSIPSPATNSFFILFKYLST